MAVTMQVQCLLGAGDTRMRVLLDAVPWLAVGVRLTLADDTDPSRVWDVLEASEPYRKREIGYLWMGGGLEIGS